MLLQVETQSFYLGNGFLIGLLDCSTRNRNDRYSFDLLTKNMWSVDKPVCAHIELSLKCLNNDIEEAERRGVGLNDLLGGGWFRTQQTKLARVLFGEQIENASMLFKPTDRRTHDGNFDKYWDITTYSILLSVSKT